MEEKPLSLSRRPTNHYKQEARPSTEQEVLSLDGPPRYKTGKPEPVMEGRSLSLNRIPE